MQTRQEFENLRITQAQLMAEDTLLKKAALDVKVQAGHEYYWVHQTNWMGEPCLQLPQDMFAFQEAVYKSRPAYVIECGVAWGGTLLFFASLLSLLGGKKVIGIDIYIPEDLKTRIQAKLPYPGAVELIQQSSASEATLEQVKSLIEPDAQTLVLLDSNHTHDHVLAELRLYSQLVKPGGYLICGDTIIDQQPPADKRPRAWGAGNNPATALRQFMEESGDFEVDTEIENKLLLSNMPGGYLRRKNR